MYCDNNYDYVVTVYNNNVFVGNYATVSLYRKLKTENDGKGPHCNTSCWFKVQSPFLEIKMIKRY